MANQFWQRWQREYLVQLQSCCKWHKERDNLRIGDVVLMVKDDSPRNFWPLGRVMATYPGNDGRVRTVDIRAGGSVFTRPITKLVYLEGSRDMP